MRQAAANGLEARSQATNSHPKIVSVPKAKPMQSAACARSVDRVVWRKPVVRQKEEFTKSQLYDMLAEAVRNTG
jgi:GcrA cell cycle regulator